MAHTDAGEKHGDDTGTDSQPARSATRLTEPLPRSNLERSSPSGTGPKTTKEDYRKLSLAGLIAIGTVGLWLYGSWLAKANDFSDAANRTAKWLDGITRDNVGGYTLAFGPVLLILAVFVVLLVRHGLPDVWRSVKQSAVVGLLFGGCVIALVFLRTGDPSRLPALPWLYVVPVVPAALLAYQALLVWRQRPRNFGVFAVGLPASAKKALEAEGIWRRYIATYKQLLSVFGGTYSASFYDLADGSAEQRNPRLPLGTESATAGARTTVSTAYDLKNFITRFAVPGALLLLVGFGAVSLAVQAPAIPGVVGEMQEYLQRGVRWGVAGAFVYVLMDFGARLFRNDLTVGAATWAIITLIVGPALAVVLAVAWQMKPAPDSAWQIGAVLFFAGLAPRRMISVIETVALQLLKVQAATIAPKVTPLTALRGITPEIAARLREENIDDVSTLAYADPIRLVQSLPYDLRQVINWIDSAQLAHVLPKHYDALSERGVTGAIDLAWRWLNASLFTEADGKCSIKPTAPPKVPPEFLTLSNANDSEARTLYESAAQLFYEEQVCLLWVMYNSFSTTAGSVEQVPQDSLPPPE